MDSTTPPQDSTDDLQFNTAEPSATTAGPVAACVGCKRSIDASYYTIGRQTICPSCHAVLTGPPPGNQAVRMIRAGLQGIGAGLVGAFIWFMVRRVAHAEIGLIAIVVGYLVGKTIRKASGGRGGVGFQIMAVVITYCCIAANYAPDIVEALNDLAAQHQLTIPFFKMAQITAQFALTEPFQNVKENILGLIIIGIALWEAWKLNRPRNLIINGPYSVAPAQATVATTPLPADSNQDLI